MWRAVIIEDERKIIQIMRGIAIWEELGIEVVGDAQDGQTGLELIMAEQPDIVITDIYMPVMNGLAMIEQLRERQFAGKIIVLSGYSEFEYARQALRLQVDDYLNKPISLTTMKEVLSKSIAELETVMNEQQQNERLKEKLMVYEPYVQRKWMNYVVTGARDTGFGDIEEVNRKFSAWDYKGHLVIVIEMVRTERISKLSIVDHNLFYFALSNIIEEIAAEGWPESELVELYSHHCALLLHVSGEGDGTEAEARVIKLTERIAHAVYSFLKIEIVAGIGGMKRQWREIAASTEEGFNAIYFKNNRLSKEHKIFALPDSLDKEQYQLYQELKQGFYPFKMYQELSEAVVHAQIDQAIAIIQQFIIQQDGINKIPIAYIRHFCSELWGLIANALSQAGIDHKQLQTNDEIYAAIEALTTAKEMEMWLIGKLQQIGEQFHANANVKHLQAVEFIIQYVHEHYQKELTLTGIADEIGISRSYLSHIFKKSTDETFNTYLTKVRMEKAKALIMEGKHLIYEVADMVGYKNVPYFSTLFKKYTGMNPTQLFETYNSALSSNIENNRTSPTYPAN
ncbi:response regulator transcription factor [Paenibacillus nasutitermitis]|uniref:AraC family transcriptional regulator n=1 Tax=Paenibacillus nasutitermitis TaxID=1652958 RepID=A0A916YIZ6_9BACL|nr:response regulator [Paenibacillus nasutitermitis]GGD47401.1 AraC family transcriptional regulator [Paenibacillus nasutitermitis]